MDIARYFTESNGAVSFTEEQGSAFAKGIAGDFNPIHDPGSKRFCVPGDLLFSVLLQRYGVAQTTSLQFSGMLDGNTRMLLPTRIASTAHITDDRQRPLLSLFLGGSRIMHQDFIAQLCEQYVRFSGKTFPDILVPLMRGAGVMINPARPLVIYKDMAIEFGDAALALFSPTADGTLHHLSNPLSGPLSLDVAATDISVNGRKGAVRLSFNIDVGDQHIGRGQKNMVLSGLRDYEENAMQDVVAQYNDWRTSFAENANAM